MKALHELREMLCKKLEEFPKGRSLGGNALEELHMITDTIKNIDKIIMLEEEGGYSQAGIWEAEMRGDYGGGNSYARRGQHYVRGHYSRDGYSNDDGYSQDGYSRDGYSQRSYSRDDQPKNNSLIEHLRRTMEGLRSQEEKEAVRRCIEQLERGKS